MENMILSVALLLLVANSTMAQAKPEKKPVKTSTIKSDQQPMTQKVNTSSYSAKMPAIPSSGQGWLNTPIATNSLQIADPVVRTLNERANGAFTPIDFREFMGVGRGTYGVANGQLLLRPNGATTSGGITGSGAVGTGSTPGGVGVHGTALGVNGKNPYAGPGMWGTTGTGIGTNFQMNASSSKPIRLKKED